MSIDLDQTDRQPLYIFTKSGCSRLQEVPNIVIDLDTFGILENWLLKRGGRLQEVVTTRGSTVFTNTNIYRYIWGESSTVTVKSIDHEHNKIIPARTNKGG